jgi:hypothetical protein
MKAAEPAIEEKMARYGLPRVAANDPGEGGPRPAGFRGYLK